MSLGDRIKQLRTEYNITQLELAEELGKKKNTVSNYENGVSMPDLTTAMEIAKFFHCSLDYLTGLTDNRFREDDNINNYIKINAYKIEKGKIITPPFTNLYISKEIHQWNTNISAVLCENNRGYLLKKTYTVNNGDNIFLLENKFYTGKFAIINDVPYCITFSGGYTKIQDTNNIIGILLKSFDFKYEQKNNQL